MDKRNREITLRDRTDVDIPSLKKVENLPPREIQKAVLGIVKSHLGVSADEISKEVAQALGFKYAAAQLRDHVAAALSTLAVASKLRKQPDERGLQDAFAYCVTGRNLWGDRIDRNGRGGHRER